MGTPATAGKQRRARRRTGTGPGRLRSCKRYLAAKKREADLTELYGRLVASTLAVRRDRFSMHIKRVVAHVRQSKGWTLKQLLDASGVNKPTYYRWVNKEWTGDLEPSPIERFHDAADWPVSDAWEILWPGKFSRRRDTEPVPIPEEWAVVFRALDDPNTAKEDLIVIQATLEMLMARVGKTPRRSASN